MSTFRIQKRENPFVQIDKTMIYDNQLSFKAKGILSYLLSRPDDWKVYEVEIVKHAKDGRDSVRSGIKELVDCGYIERKKIRGEKGKFEGYEYLVYETSDHNGFSNNGNSYNGKPNTTNKEITNNKITDNKKIYLISENEANVFSYYSQTFKEKFGKDHPTMTQDKLELLESQYNRTSSVLDIGDEQWMELVDYHFDNLPESNNGNMLSFLAENGGSGCVFRYFQEEGF